MKNQSLVVIFIVAISVAIGINVGQFKPINEKLNNNYTALNISKSGNLVDVAMSESASLRGYYLPWTTLSKVAPSSTLFVDENSNFYRSGATRGRIEAFGATSEIKPINLDTDVLTGVEIERYIVASGESMRDDLPYFAIAMNVGDNSRIVKDQKGLYAVENTPVREGASFILIEWSGPDEAFHPLVDLSNFKDRKAAFYALLLETSLLSEEDRKSLGI